MPDFDFRDFFSATGWDRPTCARELGVSKRTVDLALEEGGKCSKKTAIKAGEAAQRLIERMRPFALKA